MRETIGDRIKSRRRELSLTQAELGILVGLNHSFISHVEHGTRRLKNDDLDKIARALKVERKVIEFGSPVEPARKKLVEAILDYIDATLEEQN